MAGKPCNNIDIALGKKINTLRISMRMSRKKMGPLIGVAPQQLHKYEKGVNRIAASRLFYIAKVLNKPISYFFEDIEGAAKIHTTHERLLIELSRIFQNIKNPHQQTALVSLARTLN